MELAIDAIRQDRPLDLIDTITEIQEPTDIRILIDETLRVQDYDTLWYIIESRSGYDQDLDEYLLTRCGKEGQSLPCSYFQHRENPIEALRLAIDVGDLHLFVYALDLSWTPIIPGNLVGYTSEDYRRAKEIHQDNKEEILSILQEATPTFRDLIFRYLPNELQINL